jgi:gluconolactonase
MQITRRHMLITGASVLTAAHAPRVYAGWEPSDRYPDPAVSILGPGFAKYRLNNAGVERLATGMR